MGSQVLFRADLFADRLIGYIRIGKQAVPGLPIRTADTPEALEQRQAVISEIDVEVAYIYPFWAGVALNGVVPWLSQQYQRVRKPTGNKLVVIGETLAELRSGYWQRGCVRRSRRANGARAELSGTETGG